MAIMDWFRDRFKLDVTTRTQVKKVRGTTWTKSQPVVHLNFSLFKPKAKAPTATARRRPTQRVTKQLDGTLFCPNCGREVRGVGHKQGADNWCPRCCANLRLPGLEPVDAPPKRPRKVQYSAPGTFGARVEEGVIRVVAHSRDGHRVKAYTRRRPK